MSGLFAAAEALGRALDGFEARLLSGADAARVVEVLAPVVKRAQAVVAQAGLRAAECGAHRDQGFANPSEWLSRTTGTSSGEAKGDLELAAALDDLPGTKAALGEGRVSLDEAKEIAKTEQACPGTEAEMLSVARERGLRGVRERGRRKRQDAMDVEELARKRRKARQFRRWTDELGMVCGTFCLEPQYGVPLLNRLDTEIDRAWRAGDAEYRSEPRDARAADALVALLEGKGTPSTTRPELVLVYDLDAGRAHIPAVGPIDHRTLWELSRDAVVTAVAHDGEDVRAYKRWSKHVPKHLRLLLSLGPPPEFDGSICERCGRRYHLQIDHEDPRANGGPTTWELLDPLCPSAMGTRPRRTGGRGSSTAAAGPGAGSTIGSRSRSNSSLPTAGHRPRRGTPGRGAGAARRNLGKRIRFVARLSTQDGTERAKERVEGRPTRSGVDDRPTASWRGYPPRAALSAPRSGS